MKLNGKVAYVTGGTKGIGFGVAQCLLDQGMKVAISGRNKEGVEAAIKALDDNKNVLGICSDVSILSDEEKAIKQILNKWGQVDLVLANAGVGHFAPIDEMEESKWHQMINTNLNGVFHTLKACVEALKKSEGYYMTLASLAGTNFFAQGAGYNATKFGVVGFTQAAMLDLRKYNIKVTTIMPGSVATHFNGNDPSEKDAWKIQAEDIGKLVMDLLQMHPRTLPSKIEVRPTRPDLK
ncbi:SDR family oxidoreductase [Flagellimonas pacifica]|uniref:NADP-dependent 3-hydroxy acid dehydrogenase YdfG n=1 Tax=Flagellimonas pacifica TaxID=1247520 RepID=A0A285MH91_9FLAO|nr:SDR family oxidoreductase [Allomuricauda parva]SNY94851.1 NADP-dependent 3-hydroxy acid dehydrogenase YdfG [Allomuricauda parva]